jgi:tetratricopeptide (TPR) repeat protein
MPYRILLCVAAVAALGSMATTAQAGGSGVQDAARIIAGGLDIAGVALDAQAQRQWDRANEENIRGNTLFAAGDLDAAMSAYDTALSYLDDPVIRENIQKLRRAMWNQVLRETEQAEAVKQAALNVATAAEFDRLTAPK